MEYTEGKHSPTPWKIEINDGDFDVVDANGQAVAIASTIYPECTIGIDKEDAHRIVACVNALKDVDSSLLERYTSKEVKKALEEYHGKST